MDVYYKADSYIMTEAEGFKISRTNYIFEGWYYVEPDESGIVQTLGKRVEVGDRIASGEHKYVIANWNAEIAIDVYLVADGFDVKQTVIGQERAECGLCFHKCVLGEEQVGFAAPG